MLDTNTIWEKVLHDVESSVSKANFSTWFKNTHIAREEDGIVYIGVPNEFVKEWLYTKYHKNILKSLREGLDHIRSIEYVVARKDPSRQRTTMKTHAHIQIKELPLGDLYINRDDNLNPRYTFDSFIIGPFNELAYSAIQSI
jgi:chromosomal replication initiator protein